MAKGRRDDDERSKAVEEDEAAEANAREVERGRRENEAPFLFYFFTFFILLCRTSFFFQTFTRF